MKSLPILSVSLAVAALAGAPAIASGQPADSDSVAGEASECLNIPPTQTFCDRTFSFDVDVESGPVGENPAGAVGWYDAGPTPGASSIGTTAPTCLSVRGNVAIIGVTGSWEHFGAEPGVHPIAGLVRIVDAGGTDSGGDRLQFAIQTGPEDAAPLPGPTTCSTFPGPFPTGSYPFPDFKNETGDVVVADTRPAPTSKHECSNGAWRDLAFNSHAQCVNAADQQARRECTFIRATHGQPAFRAWYGSGVHKRHAMRRCIRDRSGS